MTQEPLGQFGTGSHQMLTVVQHQQRLFGAQLLISTSVNERCTPCCTSNISGNGLRRLGFVIQGGQFHPPDAIGIGVQQFSRAT